MVCVDVINSASTKPKTAEETSNNQVLGRPSTGFNASGNRRQIRTKDEIIATALGFWVSQIRPAGISAVARAREDIDMTSEE